jgi:hypothetical protein
MKKLNRDEFKRAAGIPITRIRDFSLYNGAPYECVCGSIHSFSEFSGQAFVSTGVNARFMVPCPDTKNAATLIETRNKFFVKFDRFISLAGYVEE